MSKFDNEEREIHAAFSQIKVNTDGLARGVKNKMNDKSFQRAPRIKGFSLAIAMVAILTITTTAFAAVIGDFDWFMERFNPPFAEIVEAVEAYSEDQGIRMEVIGAQRYDNMAVIYLSIQDISGENRLNGQVGFRDGFRVGTPGYFGSGMSSRWNILYFDEKTNTVYLEITVVADALVSDLWEIGACRIFFGETWFDEEPIPLSLADVNEGSTVPIVSEDYIWNRGFSVLDAYDFGPPIPEVMLTPGYYGSMIYGESDIWISNIGIVDGRFHVQVGRYNNEFGPITPALVLIASDGETIFPLQSITVLLDEDLSLVNGREHFASGPPVDLPPYKFSEFTFDVDIDNLQYYTLVFSGNASLGGTEGNWRIAVNTGDTTSQMIALTNDIPIGNYLFEFMTLSPLGLNAIGSYIGELELFSDIQVKVEMADNIVELGGGGGPIGEKFNLSWQTETPLDITNVTAIIIEDLRIPIAR